MGEFNLRVVFGLLGVWLVLLLVVIFERAAVFRALLPIVSLALIGYVLMYTVVFIYNMIKNERKNKDE